MEYLHPRLSHKYPHASMTFHSCSTDSIKPAEEEHISTGVSIPFQSRHIPLKTTAARRTGAAACPAEIGDAMFSQIKNLRSAFPSMNPAAKSTMYRVMHYSSAGKGAKRPRGRRNNVRFELIQRQLREESFPPARLSARYTPDHARPPRR